ncbi:16635_t:CDS:2, partial [Funneliformis geosporum]
NYLKISGYITQKFREYQQNALEKLNSTILTWHNTYEILALSSIMVLNRSCPYSNFTSEEWQIIIETNPYAIDEPVLSASISNALHEAFMHSDETQMSKASSMINMPTLLTIPINPIFFTRNKDYEVRLDRSVKDTKQRPDLSCTVDAHVQSGKTINQLLSSKGGPGESAIFLNCGDVIKSYIIGPTIRRDISIMGFQNLLIDEPSLPLVESNFAHYVALEIIMIERYHSPQINKLNKFCTLVIRKISRTKFIVMAHDFVGSNNINIYGEGQFGTRAQGGKDVK